MSNSQNNWGSFIYLSFITFLIVLLCAISSACSIVILQIFPHIFKHLPCDMGKESLFDLMYPIDKNKYPYGPDPYDPKNTPECNDSKIKQEVGWGARNSCAYDKIIAENNNESEDLAEELFWAKKVTWPYNKLYLQEGESNGVARWYNYKISYIIYLSHYWGRNVFHFISTSFMNLTKVFGAGADTFLLMFGPNILIPLMLLMSIFAAIIGACAGALPIPLELFFTVGTPPNIICSIVMPWLCMGMCALCLLLWELPDRGNWWKNASWIPTGGWWWLITWIIPFIGYLLDIIILAITICGGGFLIMVPMMSFLIFSIKTVFSVFYPIFAKGGKYLMYVLFCNATKLALMYIMFMCVTLSWANQDHALAGQPPIVSNAVLNVMWGAVAIILFYKIIRSFF